MLVSYRNNFLFVHVYKVAGTSVTKSLRNSTFNFYELLQYRILSKLHLYNPYCPVLHHPKAREIRDKIGAEKYSQLFKFAFVRNPWDWQVSLYNFMLQNTDHFQHDLIKEMSFEEYIEWRVTQKNDLQKDYVTDESDRVIVDFIGRFENLHSDFQKISEQLNINVKLPHLNQSQRKRDYKDYYNDKSKVLIYEHFKEDIELFEYSF